ncbi:unnamed protein product [Dicrocoelium dendriticum]|nr:unnamed protein product [Dicrocoelium dendriticum]
MSYFYAKWDADSTKWTEVITNLHSFSPIKISAVDCWMPNSPCAKSFKLKRFPHLIFHRPGFNAVSYEGTFSTPQIAAHISHVLNPIVLANSRTELSRLQLIHKVVVFGQFGHQNLHLRDFVQFHSASLMTNIVSTFGLTLGKDIIFAASGNATHFRSTNASTQIRLYVSCASTTMVHHIPFTQMKAERFIEDLRVALKHLKPSAPVCIHPTELGSPNHRRSTLLHSAISRSPVLFLIGPHLSVMKSNEPELFLLRSLELSYYWCNSSAVAPSPRPSKIPGDGWALIPRPSWEQAVELLAPVAAAADRYRCRLSLVCPKWLKYLGSPDVLGHNRVCRLANPSTNTTDSNFTTGDSFPVLSQLMRAIEDGTRSSEIRATAQCLLHRLSDDGDSQACAELLNHRDWRVIIERLHFSCCQWYHRQLPDASYPLSSNCTAEGDRSTVNLRPDWTASSPLHGLSCNSNRTLTFHTLDSIAQPQLAWELAGYDASSNRNDFMVIIVDQQMEAVYRLERPISSDALTEFIVGFHDSALRPWSKYTKPLKRELTEQRGTSPVIEIRSAAQLNALLDQRTSIRFHDNLTLPSSAATHLVLLYYVDGCAYASHGSSWRWHFEAVAHRFKPQNRVTFARVDVFAVDLPWNLRVERVPSILFFPSTRSSYSSVFSIDRFSRNDVSTELIRFLHEKMELPHDSAKESHINPDVASFHARLCLLQSLDTLPYTEPKYVADRILQTCRDHSSAAKRMVCFSALFASVRRLAKLYQDAQSTSSAQLRRLASSLNSLNSRLTSPAFHLYAPSHQIHRLLQSVLVQSKLWHSLSDFHRNASTIVHFLTVQLPSTVSLAPV